MSLSVDSIGVSRCFHFKIKTASRLSPPSFGMRVPFFFGDVFHSNFTLTYKLLYNRQRILLSLRSTVTLVFKVTFLNLYKTSYSFFPLKLGSATLLVCDMRHEKPACALIPSQDLLIYHGSNADE